MITTLEPNRTAPMPLLNRIHPAFRPMVLGAAIFLLANLLFSILVTFSPLNQRFNFSYGNFLPAKLARLKQMEAPSVDVLFLGTSQTNNGFATHAFEQAHPHPVRSFNLGLPNNRYDVMAGTLQLFIKQYGKPKLLLVELSPSIQERNSPYFYLPALYYRTMLEQSPDLLWPTLTSPWLDESVKRELLLSGFSSLYQYRYTFSPANLLGKAGSQIQHLYQRSMPSAHADDTPMPLTASKASTEIALTDIPESWLAGGWYPKAQSPQMTSPEGLRLSLDEARKYYIDTQKDVHFDKLDALLRQCRQWGIPVVLVSWPNHPEFVEQFQASPLHAPYEHGLRQLVSRHDVPVIHLGTSLVSGEAELSGLFADPRHLTPTGAMRFSRQLAHQVQRVAPQHSRVQTPP